MFGSVLQKQWLEMEKGKTSVVYLVQRDSGHAGRELKKVDWDDLVDDVFKEEVDQFFIESGVQLLHIRQRTNSWCVSQPTTLSEHGWTSPSNTSSCSSNTFNNWKPSGSQDLRGTKDNFPSPIDEGCCEKKQTELKESSATQTQQNLICTK